MRMICKFLCHRYSNIKDAAVRAHGLAHGPGPNGSSNNCCAKAARQEYNHQEGQQKTSKGYLSWLYLCAFFFTQDIGNVVQHYHSVWTERKAFWDKCLALIFISGEIV